MELLREDPSLTHDKHGLAQLNGQDFLYRRPDGSFLFDIFKALFLRLPGLRLTLDVATFPRDKLVYNAETRQYAVHLYFDVGSSNRGLTSLNIEFPAGGNPPLHEFKPRFPNTEDLSPSEYANDIYTVPIKCVVKYNKRRLYQIYCLVNEDLTFEMVTFSSPYIFTNEFGHDQLAEPFQWMGRRGSIHLDDIEPEILPVSRRAQQKKRSIPDGDVAEADIPEDPPIEVVVPAKKPKSRKPKTRDVESEELENAMFESRARFYAVNHLLNDPDVRHEAIQRGVELVHGEIMQTMEPRLVKKVMGAMIADPERFQGVWIAVREKALNHIVQTEGGLLRQQIMNHIYAMEMQARQQQQPPP